MCALCAVSYFFPIKSRHFLSERRRIKLSLAESALSLPVSPAPWRICRRSLDSSTRPPSAIPMAPTPAKQLFSFKLSENGLNRLSCAAEQYLLTQTGRRFGTLDYWKKVKYDRKKPPPQGEVLSEAKRKGARSAVRWYPLQTRHCRASSP